MPFKGDGASSQVSGHSNLSAGSNSIRFQMTSRQSTTYQFYYFKGAPVAVKDHQVSYHLTNEDLVQLKAVSLSGSEQPFGRSFVYAICSA